MGAPTSPTNPVVVIDRDEDSMRVRFQDPETREDLATVILPRTMARAVAADVLSCATPPAPGDPRDCVLAMDEEAFE